MGDPTFKNLLVSSVMALMVVTASLTPLDEPSTVHVSPHNGQTPASLLHSIGLSATSKDTFIPRTTAPSVRHSSSTIGSSAQQPTTSLLSKPVQPGTMKGISTPQPTAPPVPSKSVFPVTTNDISTHQSTASPISSKTIHPDSTKGPSSTQSATTHLPSESMHSPASASTTSAPIVTTSGPFVTTSRPVVTTSASRANKTICYEYLGCFDNFPPFDNGNLDLPVSPDVIDTKFYLFTRDNHDNDKYDLLDYKNETSFDVSHFNPKWPTKVIIHGFSQNGKVPWMMEMKDELLKKDAFNVILVDWGKGAVFPDYAQALTNTRVVATELKLILDLMTQNRADMVDVHLIGHSLGAHLSGYTSFLMGGNIGRITGMDPAGPDFENLATQVRLDPDDAVFVDVIHTSSGALGEGMMEMSGHVDFYVNGGQSQPGCSILKGILGGTGNVVQAFACSHSRSHVIFTESINTDCPFTSYPCASYEDFKKGKCLSCGKLGCSQFGYYADQYSARGKMYLNTAPATPFCGFHYAVSFYMPNGTDSRGRIAINIHGTWAESGFLNITDSDDATLKAGTAHTQMLLSPVEVGDVTSVSIQYKKYSGGWLFGKNGVDKIKGDRLEITSGENGSKYLFCLTNNDIIHNQTLTINLTNAPAC